MSQDTGWPLTPTSAAQLERDPVCGMNVNPATAKHTHEHAGRKYYFCCGKCLEKFSSSPDHYLNGPTSSGLVMLGMPAAKPAAPAPLPASVAPSNRTPARSAA